MLISNTTQTCKLCGNLWFNTPIRSVVNLWKSIFTTFYPTFFFLFVILHHRRGFRKIKRFFVLFFIFLETSSCVRAPTISIVSRLCFNFKYFVGPFISVNSFDNFLCLPWMRFFCYTSSIVDADPGVVVVVDFATVTIVVLIVLFSRLFLAGSIDYVRFCH